MHKKKEFELAKAICDENIRLSFSWINNISIEVNIAEDIDFYQLYSHIKEKFPVSYFFESLSLPRHQDRYYTIGFDPCVVFSAQNDDLCIEGYEGVIKKITGQNNDGKLHIRQINPFKLIQSSFPKHLASKSHQGGLIGYFSHEAINLFEESIQLPTHEDFGLFKLGLYLDGLIYDTVSGSVQYYSYAEDRSKLVRNLIAEAKQHSIPHQLENVEFKGHSVSKEQYINAVETTRQKIIEGYSFQSEVGFKSFFDIKGKKIAIYNKLREINPSPYMYYLQFHEKELLGASPEILVSCKQNRAISTPTAGTIVRGQTEKEDIAFARKLLGDPKEIAEHNMLVDLHRNDLARVSKPGSVRVEDLMFIIKFSHVQHIVSLISSELLPYKTSFDLLASVLPGGVTTGAPKIETVKIIHETEKDPRGPYGGAVGRFSYNGDCDFCLPIRSIFCVGDNCYAQTSAGIVYDSIAENEYKEVHNKLAAMAKALEELGGKID